MAQQIQFSKEELEEAKMAVPEFSLEELEEAKRATSDGPTKFTPEMVETAARSALSSASLGITEPATSALNAAIGGMIDRYYAGKEKELGLPTEKEKSFSELYQEDVSRRRALQSEYPKTDIAGALAGALIPTSPAAALFKGAAKLGQTEKLGASIAGIAGKAAEGAAPKISEKLAGIAGKAVEGATSGALGAAGAAAVQDPILEASGFRKEGEMPSIAEQAAMGGLIGGAIGVAPGTIRLGMEVTKAGAKKMLSVLGGVKPETIEYYAQNRPRIMNAPTLEETMLEFTGFVEGLKERVLLAKDSRAEAGEALKAAIEDLKWARKLELSELADLEKSAKKALDDAHKVQVAEFKAMQPPKEIADEVENALAISKEKVVAESNAAVEMLKGRKEKLSTKDLADFFESKAKEQTQYGQVVGDEKTYNELMSLAEKLRKYPDQIPLDEARIFYKHLDTKINSIGDWNRSQGAFNDPLEAALKEVRGKTREEIGKLADDFDKHMNEVVVPLTEQHSAFVKEFGKPDRVLQKVAALYKPKNEGTRELFNQLGKTAGMDLEASLLQYKNAQQVLENPLGMDFLKKGLPEATEYRMTQQMVDMQKKVSPQVYLKQEAQKLDEMAKYLQAQAKFEAEQEVYNKFKEFGERSGPSKLLAIAKGKNPIMMKKFRELSGLAGVDFERNIKDAMTRDAFSGEFIRGSRNVNLWALIGAGAGATGKAAGMDWTTSALTTTAGGVFGGIVDKFGPKMTQKIIDGVLAIEGIPTIQKIRSLDIPPQAKQYLEDELVRIMSTGAMQGSLKLKPEEKPFAVKEVKDSEALSATEKAKAISKINKNGNFDVGEKISGVKRQGQPAQKQDKSPTLKSMSDALKSKREAF